MKTKPTLSQRLSLLYRKQTALARHFLVANLIAVLGSLGASFWVIISHLEQ